MEDLVAGWGEIGDERVIKVLMLKVVTDDFSDYFGLERLNSY